MATTIKTWKETYRYKYNQHGFNWFNLFDIVYEILIRKKLSDDKETVWFNAYVKFQEPLRSEYLNEGYRNKNIVGVDTSDATSMAEIEQIALVRKRIIGIIEQHHNL